MKVTVVGCGEAFDEAFPNTSLYVEGPISMLLDCGYSVPPRFWSMGVPVSEPDLIYISHAHADHYFGLPGLLGRMWEEGRTKPLVVLSQPGVLDQIKDVLEYGYRTLANRFAFPLEYRAADGVVECGGVHFSFAPTTHAVTNYAVRIESEGRTVFYSGDGAVTEPSKRLMADADLAVHEAWSYDPHPVHADIPTVIAAANEGRVKTVALVHVRRGLRRELTEVPGAQLPVPGDAWTL